MIFHALQRKICKQASISIAIPAKIAYVIFIKFYIWESFNQICEKNVKFWLKLNNDLILHKFNMHLGHI